MRRSLNTAQQTPQRLSKAGEWRRQNPEGAFVISDIRAVMK